MNNLDWYESWAEDFRDTELDFVLLDIHKPKLQTYDFRGSKAHDTSYHKKGKIWQKKRINDHKPAWDVRGKEMCIKKAKRRYTVLKSWNNWSSYLVVCSAWPTLLGVKQSRSHR